MSGIAYVIYLCLTIYLWLVIARVFMSWLRLRPGGALDSIYQALGAVTEPYLRFFHRIVPRVGKAEGIDLSPIVAMVVLFFAMQVVARF